jgi:hypothetical protein
VSQAFPFPRQYHAGGVLIRPATVLAPMAGVTDTVFRQFIRNQGGCGLLMTEFTSSHGITHSARARNSAKLMRYLYFAPDERPISAQLFGADPKVMADAARVCEDLGFDAVDINFGCPVKKVVRCNGGSGCLRDLPLMAGLMAAVRTAIKIPLTIKIRAGWNDEELVHVNVARMAEDLGVAAVALHPRTREQGYSGRADWTRIAEVNRGRFGHRNETCSRRTRRTPGARDRLRRSDDRARRLVNRRFKSPNSLTAPIRPSEQHRGDALLQDAAGAAKAMQSENETVRQLSRIARRGLRAEVYRSHDVAEIRALVDRFFERELAGAAA